MKERLKYLRTLFSFRTMWENQEEEDWEDYDQKDNYISGEGYADDTRERAGLGSGIVYNASITIELSAAKLEDKANDAAAKARAGSDAGTKNGVLVTAKPVKSRFCRPMKVKF